MCRAEDHDHGTRRLAVLSPGRKGWCRASSTIARLKLQGSWWLWWQGDSCMHQRDRAAFLEEKKKRKAAQREASKLHKVVKLMQRAAAADAEARLEEGQRRESEEAAEAQMQEVVVAKAREEARLEIDREKEEARGQVRAAEERAEQAEARAAVAEARVAEREETTEGRVATVREESEEARKLLEAQVVQVGETVEAERRERERVVERERMEVGRREEAEARVAELEKEMEEKGKAVEQAQVQEVRAMRDVRLGEEVERRKGAEARVAGLEEEAESRVASMRKEKEEAFARAVAVAKTAAGREAELREKAAEIDMLEREVAGLKKEVREGGRIGVSTLAPGSRPIQARFDDQGRLYWADIASGRCTWAWPGQGSPPSAEAIKEAQPQMADVRPT